MGTPMIFDVHDYTEITSSVNLCSLKSFRDYQDVLLLCKIIYQIVDSESLFSIIRFNDHTVNLCFNRLFNIVRDNTNFCWKPFLFTACYTVNNSKVISDKLCNKFYSFKICLNNKLFKFE